MEKLIVWRNFGTDFLRTWSLARACLRLAVGLPLARLGVGDRPEVRFRKNLQRLGMTYLKLGQFLALRIDLLPARWCEELAKLFEQTTPMSPAAVRAVVESECDDRLERLFLSFRWEPLAAASVAQVHEARTRAGERVAVKVQRRGLESIFAADMRNLNRLAAVIDSLRLVGAIRVRDVAREFAHFTWRELDFRAEGKAADRLRLEAVSGEIVPRIIWPLSTGRVLTMEFVEGISLAKVKELIDRKRMDELAALIPGFDLRRAVRNLATASLRQLLVTGFFHADLHPGNVFLCRGNRIAFLDCGIHGAITEDQREGMAGHIEQIALGNIDESFLHYARMFTATAETDYAAFEREGKAVLRRWLETSRDPGAPANRRLIAGFSDQMFAVVRRNHLIMALDKLLFWRALIILDATVLQLCPEFDMLQELRGFFERHRPGLLGRLRGLVDLEAAAAPAHLAGRGPLQLEELLRAISGGRWRPRAAVEESPDLRRQSNRRLDALALCLFGVSLALLQRIAPAGYPRGILLALALVCLLAGALRGPTRAFQRSLLHKTKARM